MTELKNKLHSLPKADVHHHLHLGGDIRELQKRHNRPDFSIPLIYPGLPGFLDFIHDELNTLIRTADDAVHLMDTAIQNSIADNVKHLEASVDMKLIRFFDGSLDALIEVVGNLQKKYSSELDFKPDIGLNKDLPIEEATNLLSRCIASEVFAGIDIYGPEHGKDLSLYRRIYDMAREAGLRTKVHVGEFSGADTIDTAVAELNPEFLQHGIRAVDSEKTLNEIGARGICLNICPQSNVALGAAGSLPEHPIRSIFDQRIAFTINTDDYMLFGASVTDQYLALIEADVFSLEEIEEINTAALKRVGYSG